MAGPSVVDITVLHRWIGIGSMHHPIGPGDGFDAAEALLGEVSNAQDAIARGRGLYGCPC
jgi:hypothetical protein